MIPHKAKTYVPIVVITLFAATHQSLHNSRAFDKESYLTIALITAALSDIILTILARFWKSLEMWLDRNSPIAAMGFTFLWLLDVVTLKSGLLPLPFFPSPGAVLSVLVTDWQTILVSTLYSLRLLFTGYLLGLALGLPTGVYMGWNPRFSYWITPILRFIGPIPATAWIPLVMVLFPNSFSGSVFLVALSSWFPITVMTSSGILNVDKAYYDVARTLGANERFLILKVALPAAMPSIFVGLFMGLGTAFVTLIVGEMLGVKAGLGWYIQWAQGWAEYVKVYAALVVMALLFSSIITLLFRFRDKVLVWQKGLIKW